MRRVSGLVPPSPSPRQASIQHGWDANAWSLHCEYRVSAEPSSANKRRVTQNLVTRLCYT